MKNIVVVLGIVLSLALCVDSSVAVGEKQTAVSADGVEIAFSVEGKGKPALVFVHGWCCDRGYWRYQVHEFSKSSTVVTIDLAGHGDSGVNRKAWTVEAFGQDVVAVVEKLDLKEVILVGHSMAGAVNMEAAKRMPERVLALVGVDTYQDLERETPEEARAQFLSAFKTDFAGATEKFVRGMFPPDADSVLVEQVSSDMASAPPQVGVGALESVMGYKARGVLEGLKIPIYTINTDRFPTNIEAGKRQSYSFEVKIMPGRGHFLMLEDSKEFNRLLAETITEITSRGQ